MMGLNIPHTLQRDFTISMTESIALLQPSKAALFLELIAIKDFVSLLHPRAKRIIPQYAQSSKKVVFLPAYGTDNRYFKPLSKCLERHGHVVYDWGLGLNDAGLKRNFEVSDISDSWSIDASDKPKPVSTDEMGIPYLCTRAVLRIRALSEINESPLVLVGWSLGGLIAREAARELPSHVAHVITLGTPSIGGAKYTAAADSFRKNGIDLDWVERELKKRDQDPIQAAITIISAKYDGIIAKSASGDNISLQTNIVEVSCSHLGLCFHYPLWKIVLEILSKD
jgi:pimeloyl-ACP methyl ester carboxylesterase